jgi:hypothetical protein
MPTQMFEYSGLSYYQLFGTVSDSLQTNFSSMRIFGQKNLRKLTPSNSLSNHILLSFHYLKVLNNVSLQFINFLFSLIIKHVSIIITLNLTHYKKETLEKSILAGLEPAASRFVVGRSTIEP